MAYASQKPWLLNATVVENITFEMPMIKPRSERADMAKSWLLRAFLQTSPVLNYNREIDAFPD